MSGSAATHDTSAARGRAAADRLAWDEAFREFSDADAAGGLEPSDLELWATAAYLLGHVDVTVDALTRAHHAFVGAGDAAQGVRSGFWIAFALTNRGDIAQAGGWVARCHRLLADVPDDSAEHGYLLVPEVLMKLAVDGDYAAAHATAQRIVEIGQRTRDPDLVALGLDIRGRALMRDGHVDEGLVSLDEAMVAVVSGELTPPVAGVVYCSLIEACEEIAELRRAHEWTSALSKWCERHEGMVTFTGQCLTHRAAILLHRGDWTNAERETQRACEQFRRAADEHAVGRSFYQLGEIHRVRGENVEAEDAYARARESGHEPQPGLALLRLSQGRIRAAVSALVRLMSERTNMVERIPLLGACVTIMLEAGRLEEAAESAAELEAAADTFGTSALRAEALRARGAVLLAGRDATGALRHLRAAYQQWRDLDAPYEVARTGELIGLACRALSDIDSAEVELEAARSAYSQLGAATDLARLSTTAHGGPHGLTVRELEVLRLVATGKTNQAVANELSLAVKTIDRHVASILMKLDVPSRTAATAFAYDHGLL